MFTVNFDLSGLEGLKDLEGAIKDAAEEATQELAAMAHAKAVELAHERLHSRRQKYVDALHLTQEDGVWVLSLDASAVWIEDGLPRHSMLDALLASPKAQRAADGSAYLVVPFEHSGKGPASATPAQVDLVNKLKSEFKKRKIPWAKVERDDQGRPKVGRLHKFNVTDGPLKTHSGPGQGWGPVGDVRQGPNERQKAGGGPGGGGTPFLAGVAVYQHADGNGGVKRSVMTFRVASSKHRDQNRWVYPGIEGASILPSVEQWAEEQVEKMTPDLIEKVLAKL